MTTPMARREFLFRSAVATGAVAGFGVAAPARAEPPPETNRIRLTHTPIACVAPIYLAEAMLRQEGFDEIEYVRTASGTETGPAVVAQGRADFTQWDVLAMYPEIEQGRPLKVLAGVHAGCQELIARAGVQGVRDLAGKRIAIGAWGNSDHLFIASALAYIGIRPDRDVNWVIGHGLMDQFALFEAGKADAFLGFAPHPQILRRRGIGRAVIRTVSDRPWSQYFCCMIAGNAEFVARHPVATRRALRALLKAADLCAQQPSEVARFMVEKGYEAGREIAQEVLSELPYGRWRESNPADTLRFHALRLRDVGMIRTTPQRILDQGTDFRFLNELRKELKV